MGILRELIDTEITLDGVINLGKADEMTIEQDSSGTCTLTIKVPIEPSKLNWKYADYFKMRRVVGGKGDASP